LRALQEREVEPLGSNTMKRVDVRVIAASSVDLATLVADGRFRADLYYRLNVLPIRLPPLRERARNLEPLCEHLLEQIALEQRDAAQGDRTRRARGAHAHAVAGNVRELRNVLERACSLWDGMRLTTDALRAVLPEIDPGPTAPPQVTAAASIDALDARPHDTAIVAVAIDTSTTLTLPQRIAELERAAIREALDATGGNRLQAARRLGIARATLYQKLAAFPDLPESAADDRPTT